MASSTIFFPLALYPRCQGIYSQPISFVATELRPLRHSGDQPRRRRVECGEKTVGRSDWLAEVRLIAMAGQFDFHLLTPHFKTTQISSFEHCYSVQTHVVASHKITPSRRQPLAASLHTVSTNRNNETDFGRCCRNRPHPPYTYCEHRRLACAESPGRGDLARQATYAVRRSY